MTIQRKKRISIISLLLFLLSSCILSIGVGAVEISFQNILKILGKYVLQLNIEGIPIQEESVFLAIRAPRVLLGMIIGMTLSITGCAIQGIFRNPLAEPGLIGVSSGASLFAVIFIVMGQGLFSQLTLIFGYYALSIASFIGAMLTTWILYSFSLKQGKANISTLLLIGIAINALAMAITGLMTFIATDEQLRTITFWSLGSLGGANWKTIMAILPFCIICILGLLPFGKALNAIALGESQAEHLGIDLKKVNKYIIILSALGVGSCVAMAGIIGFIALLVPHILRISISADHKYLLFASTLLGGSLLVIADLIARTIVIPAELPIGILTSLMGAPMFLLIILKSKKERFII
ncbi:FecCD family ABC transporter permease [Sphingobacterium cellulitidis]|uniref:FecCD family ABC transporter permease n=1 Tax=Sphingobacterium cellulitidis TaxID=1768011 RepID=UPI003C7DCEE1